MPPGCSQPEEGGDNSTDAVPVSGTAEQSAGRVYAERHQCNGLKRQPPHDDIAEKASHQEYGGGEYEAFNAVTDSSGPSWDWILDRALRLVRGNFPAVHSAMHGDLVLGKFVSAVRLERTEVAFVSHRAAQCTTRSSRAVPLRIGGNSDAASSARGRGCGAT